MHGAGAVRHDERRQFAGLDERMEMLEELVDSGLDPRS